MRLKMPVFLALFPLTWVAAEQAAQSADVGVLVKRGASFTAVKSGMPLKDDDLVTLPDGARLVLKDGAAQTELIGRFTGTILSWRQNLATQPSGMRSRFMKLLKSDHDSLTPQNAVEWAGGDGSAASGGGDRDKASAQAGLILGAFLGGELRKVTEEAPKFLATSGKHGQAGAVSYACLLSYFQLGDNKSALKQAFDHVARTAFRREEAALVGYRLALLAGDKRASEFSAHFTSPEVKELAKALKAGEGAP
jgi:hypothetical protein